MNVLNLEGKGFQIQKMGTGLKLREIFSLKFLFYLFYLFPLPLNKYEYKIFNKISTVKEEVERAIYSKLIICPLIKYIK